MTWLLTASLVGAIVAWGLTLKYQNENERLRREYLDNEAENFLEKAHMADQYEDVIRSREEEIVKLRRILDGK